MTFKTQVVWNWPLPILELQQIVDYRLQLHEAGLRVGSIEEVTVITGPDVDQKTVIHEWVDEATAQDWIAFVSQFGPVSATILG